VTFEMRCSMMAQTIDEAVQLEYSLVRSRLEDEEDKQKTRA
jgi:hypothetical protein